MTKYLIIALGVLSVLLAASEYALKKSIEATAEARQAVQERDLALTKAIEDMKDSEATVEARDKTLTQIKKDARRLQDALKEAIANDDCAGKPIPPELDRLLRDRAPQARENLPVRHTHSAATDPGVDRKNMGRPRPVHARRIPSG